MIGGYWAPGAGCSSLGGGSDLEGELTIYSDTPGETLQSTSVSQLWFIPYIFHLILLFYNNYKNINNKLCGFKEMKPTNICLLAFVLLIMTPLSPSYSARSPYIIIRFTVFTNIVEMVTSAGLIFTNEFAVRLEPTADPDAIAARHGFRNLGQVRVKITTLINFIVFIIFKYFTEISYSFPIIRKSNLVINFLIIKSIPIENEW